jgi:hypothetical protein
MSSTTPWWLAQGRGVLQTTQQRVVVSIDQLAQGLSDIESTSRVADRGYLMGVRIPGFLDPLPTAWLVDHYVRHNDLIATYERPHPDHLRAQVYWRYVRDESNEPSISGVCVEGVKLIVSLQTDRLDCRPTLSVVSQLSAVQVLCRNSARDETFMTIPMLQRAGGDASAEDSVDPVDMIESPVALGTLSESPLWLIRCNEQPRSVVLMTLPADLVRSGFRRAGSRWRHEFHLLDEHLEKGVIRRAQVVAWWVPREDDEFWGLKLFRQWLATPPPLTT